jgi:hypothetical protein
MGAVVISIVEIFRQPGAAFNLPGFIIGAGIGGPGLPGAVVEAESRRRGMVFRAADQPARIFDARQGAAGELGFGLG